MAWPLYVLLMMHDWFTIGVYANANEKHDFIKAKAQIITDIEVSISNSKHKKQARGADSLVVKS